MVVGIKTGRLDLEATFCFLLGDELLVAGGAAAGGAAAGGTGGDFFLR